VLYWRAGHGDCGKPALRVSTESVGPLLSQRAVVGGEAAFNI
jgi:hypothetical protein